MDLAYFRLIYTKVISIFFFNLTDNFCTTTAHLHLLQHRWWGRPSLAAEAQIAMNR